MFRRRSMSGLATLGPRRHWDSLGPTLPPRPARQRPFERLAALARPAVAKRIKALALQTRISSRRKKPFPSYCSRLRDPSYCSSRPFSSEIRSHRRPHHPRSNYSLNRRVRAPDRRFRSLIWNSTHRSAGKVADREANVGQWKGAARLFEIDCAGDRLLEL